MIGGMVTFAREILKLLKCLSHAREQLYLTEICQNTSGHSQAILERDGSLPKSLVVRSIQ